MDAKTILTKIATSYSPAKIVKVMDWMLSLSEDHWSAEVDRHGDAMHRNEGTSMGVAASTAHGKAFDNWHAVSQLRTRISKPLHRFGGRKVETQVEVAA